MRFDFRIEEVYENRCIRSAKPDAEVIADLSTDLPQAFYLEEPENKKPLHLRKGDELRFIREFMRPPRLKETKRGMVSEKKEEPSSVFDFDKDYIVKPDAYRRIIATLERLIEQRHKARIKEWRTRNDGTSLNGRKLTADDYWAKLRSDSQLANAARSEAETYEQDFDRSATQFDNTPPRDERILPWLSPQSQSKGVDIDRALEALLTAGGNKDHRTTHSSWDWITKASLKWLVDQGRLNETELDHLCREMEIPETVPERMRLFFKPTLLWRHRKDPIRGAACCMMDYKFDFVNEADSLSNIPVTMPHRRLFTNPPVCLIGTTQFRSGSPALLAPEEWTPEEVYDYVQAHINILIRQREEYLASK